MRKKITILCLFVATLFVFVATAELVIGPIGIGPIDLDPGDGGGTQNSLPYFVQGHIYKENDEAFAGISVKITGPDGTVKTVTTTSGGFYARMFLYETGGYKTFNIKVVVSGYKTTSKDFSLREEDQSKDFKLKVWPYISTAISSFGLNNSLYDVYSAHTLARYWEITISTYDPELNDINREKGDYYFFLGVYEIYNVTSGKFKAKFYFRLDLWQDTDPAFRTEYNFLGNVKFSWTDYWVPMRNGTAISERDNEHNETLDFGYKSIFHRWMTYDWWIAEYSSKEYSAGTLGVEAAIVDASFDYGEQPGIDDPDQGIFSMDSSNLVGARIKFSINHRDYGEPGLFDLGTRTYFFGTNHGITLANCSFTKAKDSWLVAAGIPY